jgi:hypothetical protein
LRRMAQIEQLQSQAMRFGGAVKEKATAPQWQPPRWVATSAMLLSTPIAGYTILNQFKACLKQLISLINSRSISYFPTHNASYSHS